VQIYPTTTPQITFGPEPEIPVHRTGLPILISTMDIFITPMV
jgi:hypothetical protein